MPRDYREIAMKDLREYPSRKAAQQNLKDKIETLQNRFDGLSCASADTVPVQGGENRQEERIINNIVERERLKVNYDVNRKLLRIVETGLAILSDDERKILLALSQAGRNRERYVADRLADEMNMDRSTVYRMRWDALEKYTIACYGVTEL